MTQVSNLKSIHTYNLRSRPTQHSIVTNNDFTIQSYQKKIHNVNEFAVIINWTNDINFDDLDTTTHYYIQFIIDKSGSMNNIINNNIISNNITRYSVLCDTMKLIMDSFKTLIQNGMKINISIITFDTYANISYPFTTLDIEQIEYIKDNIDIWAKPSTSTNIFDAISLAQETSNVEGTYMNILLTDGYANGIHNNLLYKLYNQIDYCVGIGKKNDYDYNLLEKLSKNNTVIGSPDKITLSDNIIDLVFGYITHVCKNLTISLKEKSISPHTNIAENTTSFNFKNFHNSRYIIFTGKTSSKYIDITLTYTNSNTNILVDDTIKLPVYAKISYDNMFNIINTYCNYSHMISKDKPSKKDLQHMSIVLGNFTDNVISKNIKALKEQIDTLLSYEETSEDYGMMLNMLSIQTSVNRFPSISRESSQTTAKLYQL